MASFRRFGIPFLVVFSTLGVVIPAAGGEEVPAGGDLEAITSEALSEVAEERVLGQIVVTYREGAGPEDRERVRSFGESASPLMDGVDLVEVDERRIVEALVSLKSDPAVLEAEPDRVIETTVDVSDVEPFSLAPSSVPTDPGLSIPEGWDMQGRFPFGEVPASPFGSNATEAWYQGYRSSSDVVVAVVDSGLDISHPDIAANVWKNTNEVAGNGRDDDGNGFVDDVNGWNFYNNTNRVYMDPEDDLHGTHIAGTIAAVANNNIGIAGVASRAKILPVKFLGADGEGSLSGAVAAVNYVTTMKKAGAPITAINASWGGSSYSSSLATAINAAGNENILFVAAAGNDGVSQPFYPAAQTCSTKWGVDCIVSVAAHNQYGVLAYFSNYGTSIIDISSPGEQILSLAPGNQYAIINGTSMAAPHVTAAVATCRTLEPVLSLQEKRDSILGTALWEASLSSYVATGGRSDVNRVAASCGDARAPKMDYLPPLTSIEGVSTSLPLTAHGRNTSATWSLLSPPAGVTISTSGTITFNPVKYGDYTATVRVQNPQGGVSTATLPLRANVYDDVPAEAFYEQATHWLRVNAITNGTSPTTFGSNGNVSRAQMAAFLWRAAGSPASSTSCGFVDQSSIPAYARAGACWLKREGITVNNPFGPNGNVSRAQMAAFLWRAAGSPSASTSCGFVDQSSIPAYARAGACWLKQEEITEANPFAANNNVTRAQMAAFLWRAAGRPQ